ncbi:MAG: SGNH/GDSL hydrolase family protein [Polyangiales bacterium]
MRLLPSLLLTLTLSLGCGGDPNAPAIPPADDAGATPDGDKTPAPDAPSRDWGPPVDPTLSVPTFDAATVARVRALRAMGATRGMRPDVVAKIGDSITESASFLSDIGHGWHELGAHAYLQPTVTYFSRTRFADGTNSLNRASSCAMGGWVAAYALAMDPMSALRNEMDYTRPAYAIVMYGTNDLDRIAPEEFTRDMTRILDIIESYGSVPVMSTIPDRLDRAEAGARVPSFNEAIRAMAASRHLPLMEFWRSLQDLPRKGIDPDGIHPSAYVSNGNVACGVLTPDGLRFGYNMRNLVALFALDRLRNLAQ